MLPRPFRVALVVATVLLLVPSACGKKAAEEPGAAASAKPDEATSQCRQQWADLGSTIEGAETKTEPSALAQRWNSIVATIDYYATTAKASDCGAPLTGQKAAIAALNAYTAKVRPFDMEYRFGLVRTEAEAYATGTSAAPHQPRAKGKHAPVPPPKEVAAAVKTLAAKAPVATQDQAPGWAQAGVVELSDKAAVQKSVKDLAFLSSESAAYAACAQALATVRKAIGPTR